MTKKKRPSAICNQARPTIDLPIPILALRTGKRGPAENGRVWIESDRLISAKYAPGQMGLLSLGPQSPVDISSQPAPAAISSITSSAEDFSTFPSINLHTKWDVVSRDNSALRIGAYCIGCQLWPNAGVHKNEVQISECLAANLGQPAIGSVLYVHSITTPPQPCKTLNLRYVSCISAVGEERKHWLEEILKENGEMQIRVLKTIILRQLNGRLMLVQNIMPVLMLGCTLVFKVAQLTSSNGSEEMAIIDGDKTEIQLEFDSPVLPEGVKAGDEDFLTIVEESARRDVVDTRKDAAAKSAKEAARFGLQALKDLDTEHIILPDALIHELRSLVLLPLTRPEAFTFMGLPATKGVLFHGPPGSGKTMCAMWIAKQSDAHLFVINGPILVSEFYGETEAGLNGIFNAAMAVSPSLIFIDEIDAIMSSRGHVFRNGQENAGNGSSLRAITALLAQFDQLRAHQVMVLAATNRLASIDEALRRPGRFDREIEIGLPNQDIKRSILSQNFSKIDHTLTKDEIEYLATRAHGFLPADLAALSREVSIIALRRYLNGEGPLAVISEDFEQALAVIQPSGLREFQAEIPRVRWDDIGGLEDVKQQLRESIEWPIEHAVSLQRLGTSAPQGILLFGPPGCSKTLLAKAAATESGMNFISVAGSDMLSMYVGQSEKAIAQLFTRARQAAPCIVFIDEVDGLLSHRNDSGEDGTSLMQRILSQILVEMDGLRDRGQVIVIGATNKPQLIDKAMLRPGRFDRLVLVPPPDFAARQSIFNIQFRSLAIADDVDVQNLSERTEGFTGADIVSVCRQAGIQALEEDMQIPSIHMRHFLNALDETDPSLNYSTLSDLKDYEAFRRGCVKCV